MENEVAEPWVGLYLPDNFDSAPQRAIQYQHLLKKKIHILSFYVAWGSEKGRPDLVGIKNILQKGFVPMITWEPWSIPALAGGARPEDQPEFSLSAILRGKYEDYIWNWALDLKDVSSPIFFRPMHEMNGNWYHWCGKVNGNTPADYVNAWRYIRAIFREAENDKMIWVWSPYVHSVPDERDNEMSRYFPGSQEVDWLGLDGYNWGTNREWSRWQSFREIFEEGYDRLTQLAPEKPLMIAEAGCAEEGGNKSRWIEETAEIMRRRFPRIQALIWFNINKECDWRIESSEESTTSFTRNWNRW